MGIEELCKPLSTDKVETNLSIEVSISSKF